MEVADCDFQMASKSQIVTLNDDHKILRSQFVTSKEQKLDVADCDFKLIRA